MSETPEASHRIDGAIAMPSLEDKLALILAAFPLMTPQEREQAIARMQALMTMLVEFRKFVESVELMMAGNRTKH